MSLLWGAKMAKRACWREIPTELSLERFEEFILPHLTVGRRGPAPKFCPFHALFNYILKLLYLGCQWKELPIEKDATRAPGDPPHPYLWRTFRRWVVDGCFNAIFEGTVLTLHQAELLDVSIIHGDGTTTAAKRGGDNIGFNGHKKIKGDKVVAFCDRNCNVIAPFISAPGNRNELPLLREALPKVTHIAGSIGPISGRSSAWTAFTIAVSFGRRFSIAAWCRTSTPIPETGNPPNEAVSHFLSGDLQRTIQHHRARLWSEDKFRRLLLRLERLSPLHYAFKTLAYTMINLRHFCQG